MVEPHAPEAVSAARLTELKLAITRKLSPQASAVLLDPVYGAGQAIAAGALPGRAGLICSLEAQGYLGDPFYREQTLLSGWSVAQASRLGATGVKLLLLYHPDSGESAARQEELVRVVVTDCRREEIPLFLEPIGYPLQAGLDKHSGKFAAERRRIVVESARRLGALGPDVLKIELPVNTNFESDRGVRAEACEELDEAAPVPWVLLSAGDPFELFKEQLEVACRAGCSGFLAGRAIWREAVRLHGDELDDFLATTARKYFVELSAIAAEYARPWYARYKISVIDERWYREY